MKSYSIPGIFRCKICDERVVEATYNQDLYLVQWECSEGHLSEVSIYSERGY